MPKQQSVVIQLQGEALDKNVTLSDLLRKAFVVARKLSLDEFRIWIENELNGYREGTEIPKYREVFGQVRGWSPYHGWQPIIFQDPEMGAKISRRKNIQSIAELESLIAKRGDQSSLHMPYSQEMQRMLSKACGFETEVSLFTSHTEIIRILDSVRNIILNWTLKLEEDGIFGEGLTFTAKERSAVETKEYNIANFYGTVHNPQLQQGSDNAVQMQTTLTIDVVALQGFLEQLETAQEQLGLSQKVQAELAAELQTVQAQAASPKPKNSIVKESLQTIRNILESAGGGVATHLLIELGKLAL